MTELRPFEPYAMLAALDRHRVTYLVIGTFARVVRGAEEPPDGLDIVPSLRAENLRRLEAALRDLEAVHVEGTEISLDEGTAAGCACRAD